MKNEYAQDLRTPKYRKRVVVPKKVYNRQRMKNESEQEYIEDADEGSRV
jgi:hypothetical protein